MNFPNSLPRHVNNNGIYHHVRRVIRATVFIDFQVISWQRNFPMSVNASGLLVHNLHHVYRLGEFVAGYVTKGFLPSASTASQIF